MVLSGLFSMVYWYFAGDRNFSIEREGKKRICATAPMPQPLRGFVLLCEARRCAADAALHITECGVTY